MYKTLLLAAICAATLPAHAVDGEILITQAKALAGNVTPGDAPGFPITLSQPGKYKFASHVTVPAGASGIDIISSDITLDLNGFSLKGPVACSGGYAQLSCTSSGLETTAIYGNSRAGLTIRNGIVSGFDEGVRYAGDSSLVEDLRVQHIGGFAITTGIGSIVRGNRISHVIYGIAGNGLVIGNTITSSKNWGVHTGLGLIKDNVTAYTGDSGVMAESYGIDAGVVNNAVYISNGGGPISGGVSLGGGNTNFCEGSLC